jgi:DNA polymerase
MSWTARQRDMLQAMGLAVWAPESAESAEAPSVAAAIAPPVAPPQVARPAPAGSPGSGAALDWPSLQTAVADCRACALGASRRQAVFGAGHPQAHWMIVGEAPDEQDDRAGAPLAGPAGQLLDNMLRALQLSRVDGPPERQVFVTGAIKCHPPAHRSPTGDELSCCQPWLARQIEQVRPRMILAFGRMAVQSLLGSSEPLGRLRGRVHQAHGVPVVVSYDLPYLLRHADHKPKVWDDLCLAAAACERGLSTA